MKTAVRCPTVGGFRFEGHFKVKVFIGVVDARVADVGGVVLLEVWYKFCDK